MITIHEKAEKLFFKEPVFEIFKHKGLLCCVQRMNWSGNLNGYVAVSKDHPFFDRDHNDDEVIVGVHGGLTYSDHYLQGIDKDVFGDLWWFGFDTCHAGDLQPFQYDVNRMFPFSDDQYRNFEYVKDETKSLAEQLSKYNAKTF